MKALKFTLSGKTAFFKIQEVNTYLYYSYGHIPRIALLGLLGAIMGYKGYSDQERGNYPEFYEKLKHLKISVIPNTSDGVFQRKMQRFNNSTGFASLEAGGNLIVKQVWLEEVSWDIYIILDSKISEDLSKNILNNKAVYIPYLGSNDHFANISGVKIVDLAEVKADSINSLFKYDDFEFKVRRKHFKYEEYLPFYLEIETERHILEKMVFTDAPIIEKSNKVYSDGNVNMVFYDEK